MKLKLRLIPKPLHPGLNNTPAEFGFQLVHEVWEFVVMGFDFLKQRLLNWLIFGTMAKAQARKMQRLLSPMSEAPKMF